MKSKPPTYKAFGNIHFTPGCNVAMPYTIEKPGVLASWRENGKDRYPIILKIYKFQGGGEP
jgi:hypothetical protein